MLYSLLFIIQKKLKKITCIFFLLLVNNYFYMEVLIWCSKYEKSSFCRRDLLKPETSHYNYFSKLSRFPQILPNKNWVLRSIQKIRIIFHLTFVYLRTLNKGDILENPIFCFGDNRETSKNCEDNEHTLKVLILNYSIQEPPPPLIQ